VGFGYGGVARVQWEGQVEHTARSLLSAEDGDEEDRREVDQWLTNYLQEGGGAANARDVIRDGKLAGFTEDVLKKARKRLKLTSSRTGFGKGSTYVWSMDAHMGAMGASSQNLAPMAHKAAPMGDDEKVNTGPPGGPTDRTPGMTDRVKLALTNASSSVDDEAPCGGCTTQLINPDSIAAGLCAECRLTERTASA
jgi:hypothetical protein